MVGSGEPGKIAKPADERLRIAHAHAYVDPAEEGFARQPLPGVRQTRDAGRGPPSPRGACGHMEANLPNLGRRSVDERVELSSGPERIHEDRVSRREDELAQMHMPVARARPPDVLTRHDRFARLHDRIDVPVAKVTDAGEAARTRRCRQEHRSTFDCVDAVGSPGGGTSLGSVVADGDVDSVVVDRTTLGVRPRIEKRASNRMLAVEGSHGPPAPRVVVDLLDIELSGDPLRHEPPLSHPDPNWLATGKYLCGEVKRKDGELRMTRLLLAVAGIAAVLTSVAGAQNAFPSKIDLPNGFQPEGIATAGEQFYVGSIPTGAVYRGSLRTGLGAVLVPAASGRAAIGVKVDRGRLFVAGGMTGNAYVYNAKTGALITTYALSSGGSFVNDVVVTKRAAWFTDSFKAVLYRVPIGPGGRPGEPTSFTTVNLGGDYVQGSNFNVNGIDATANGKTLVFVQSNSGKLFTTGANGVARQIALAGGESVPNGDGVLLDGKTLYVVQNSLDVVAQIALAPNLRSGRVVRRISSPGNLDFPTTIADQGSRLYAVNARFDFQSPNASTPYWVTKLSK